MKSPKIGFGDFAWKVGRKKHLKQSSACFEFESHAPNHCGCGRHSVEIPGASIVFSTVMSGQASSQLVENFMNFCQSRKCAINNFWTKNPRGLLG